MFCSSPFGAQRRDHQRLRFAAREQCRTVGTRQHAGTDFDRTHGARVAAVDTRLAVQDLRTDDLRFDVEQHVADGRLVGRHRAGCRCVFFQLRRRGCVDFLQLGRCEPACRGSGTRRADRLAPVPPRARSAARSSAPASSPIPACRLRGPVRGSRRSRSASARGRTPRRRASLLRSVAALPIPPSAPRVPYRRRSGRAPIPSFADAVGFNTYSLLM